MGKLNQEPAVSKAELAYDGDALVVGGLPDVQQDFPKVPFAGIGVGRVGAGVGWGDAPWQPARTPWDDGGIPYTTTSASRKPARAFFDTGWPPPPVAPPEDPPVSPQPAGPLQRRLTAQQRKWVKDLKKGKKDLEDLMRDLDNMKEYINRDDPWPIAVSAPDFQPGDGFTRGQLDEMRWKAALLLAKVTDQLTDPPKNLGATPRTGKFPPFTTIAITHMLKDADHMR